MVARKLPTIAPAMKPAPASSGSGTIAESSPVTPPI
jgi:hypothetical protein